jgi:hypothetical protein
MSTPQTMRPDLHMRLGRIINVDRHKLTADFGSLRGGALFRAERFKRYGKLHPDAVAHFCWYQGKWHIFRVPDDWLNS